jgi:hypothetical protein
MPASVPGMSHPDIRVERPDQDIPPVPFSNDEDVPARRLLAHDMEHLVWDDDGDRAVPPPD